MTRIAAALALALVVVGLPAGAAAAARTPGLPMAGPAFAGVDWEAARSASAQLPDLGVGLAPGAQRAISALARGERSAAVLLGDPEPVKMASGVSITAAVRDLDGDGRDELVQFRGTPVAPTLAVVDGTSGAVRWSRALPTYQFALRFVPAPSGAGEDVLVFIGGGGLTMQLVAGDNGAQRWSRNIQAGLGIAYYGLAAGATGPELVTGRFDEPFYLETSLTLEYRSLATGALTGFHTVGGQGTFPTAGLAGDLDADGVEDLLVLEPQRAFGSGLAAAGVVQAVSRKTGTVRWSAAVALEQVDDVYLLDATDVNGDGTEDAVLLFEWLGADGQSPSFHHVSVVSGKGGDLAGLQPLVAVDLRHVAWSMSSPGDLNKDGGADLVFAGPVYNTSEGQGKVILEAVGRTGRLYQSAAGYPTSLSDFGFGWWHDGGDLDGDGFGDLLALLGTRSGGPQVSVALSSANGGQLWRREGLAGGFSAPTFADGDGDGGDEVVSHVRADHPTSTTTRFLLDVTDGRTLAPIWSHERVVDAGGNGFTIYLAGGALRGPAQAEGVVVEYVFNAGYGRHHTDVHDAASGAVLWTKP